ncbi:MAG: hypothetical protein Kow00106_07330 [Anaerolineae bacterium]
MTRRAATLALIALIALGGVIVPTAGARQGVITRLDVFVGVDPASSMTQLYFLDALSGLSTVVNVESGRAFALLGDYVLYEKERTGAIMRANANGTLQPHPFIQRGVDIAQVRWAVSPDGAGVAWVEVSTQGVSSLYVARADGSDLRQLPVSTPATGQMLLPVALTNGMTRLVYDAAHPLEPTEGALFEVYHHVSTFNLADEQFGPLTGEPLCPCGAAVSPDGRLVARLEGSGGRGPFALHLWEVSANTEIVVPPPTLPYRLAGDLILNERGTLAAYGAATEDGAPYAVIVADVVARRQRLALSSDTVRYVPLAFVDDDTALMLTDASAGGTFKFDLTTGNLLRVSDKRYLGAIVLSR